MESFLSKFIKFAFQHYNNMKSTMITRIESAIKEKIKTPFLGSGVITSVSGKQYFLKTGAASNTFACEARGLMELRKAQTIDVVNPVAWDVDFILTEYQSGQNKIPGFFEDFGKSFAQMHRYTHDTYGFYEDNFIGATEQYNIPNEIEKNDWTAFYFNKRLLFQYKLAEKRRLLNNELKRNFQKIEKNIDTILADSEEVPTLLHGDLWAGNFLVNAKGKAILIDPAVYYGHREADLAMTKVFGGFSSEFYQAYQKEYPLKEGWEYREDIYKLYHILNHLNIFGRGYLSEAESLSRKYAY